ncbi:unnamed protein product [Amoebophrya sp. A25]|nr:unnamed protein product [Amoebophrya sp. A25]|eukprot:GSA25T00005592001.1
MRRSITAVEVQARSFRFQKFFKSDPTRSTKFPAAKTSLGLKGALFYKYAHSDGYSYCEQTTGTRSTFHTSLTTAEQGGFCTFCGFLSAATSGYRVSRSISNGPLATFDGSPSSFKIDEGSGNPSSFSVV